MATILGRITVNEISVLEFDGNPSSGAGTTGQVGDFGTDTTTGIMYTKTSALATGWVQAGATPVQSDIHSFRRSLQIKMDGSFSISDDSGAAIISSPDNSFTEIVGSVSAISTTNIRMDAGSSMRVRGA